MLLDVQMPLAGGLKDAPEVQPFSDRGRQGLNLIVAGGSNKEIAEILGISAKTVDRHRNPSLPAQRDVTAPGCLTMGMEDRRA